MRRIGQKILIIICLTGLIGLAGYSYFFRNFLDGDQFLALALDATGHDPAIINEDEPEFEIKLRDRRLVIHFVFQTEQEIGIGSISLYVDPFRKTYFDVEKNTYYNGIK